MTKLSMTVQTHPDRFEAVLFEGPFVVVRAYDNDAGVSLFLRTPADCDALIAAAVEAKRLLDPPATECPKCGTEWADEHGEGCGVPAASPLTAGPCECRHGGVVHAACRCERFSPAAPVIADGGQPAGCDCGHAQTGHAFSDDVCAVPECPCTGYRRWTQAARS